MHGAAMGLLDRIQFKKAAADEPPQSIEISDKNEFLIAWPGTLAVVPALRLRDACPCAECVEEGTGRKLLVTAAIPADIRPVHVRPVGSYAVQIQWSDGHDSGIFTWGALRKISGMGEDQA